MKHKSGSVFFLSILVGILFFAQSTQAQRHKADSGILFVTLGTDTTLVERFEIKSDSIFTKIIYIPDGLTITEGKGVLFQDGQAKAMESKSYKPAPDGTLNLFQETSISTSKDSTFITTKRGEQTTRKKLSGKFIVNNEGDITTFYLFPYWGFYAPKKINDSIVGSQTSFGGKRPYVIKRKTKTSLVVGSTLMGHLTLSLDTDNKLQSIDGIGSSLNITAKVYRKMNFDSLATLLIKSQLKRGVVPPRSTRDTVTFRRGNTITTIRYSQPSMRGRKIFGAVVPWNRFWRAGANNATEIILSGPLFFEGKKLEAGTYTIFIMPKAAPEKWEIMFNKMTGIWGTDYDLTQDVLRVPMTTQTLPHPVEKLKFSMSPSRNGGKINLEWENTKSTVEFTLK